MIADSNGDRSGDTRPLWITGLSPPDSWRSLRQPGYLQLDQVRTPKHCVWGYDRRLKVRNFRSTKVGNFQSQLTHTRRWLRAGVTVALPLGFTVGGSSELRWTDYEGNWGFYTPGGEPRADRTRSLRVSVHNRAFTILGFSPQISLVNEVRTTNAQLYDYKRTGGELRFVRQF